MVDVEANGAVGVEAEVEAAREHGTPRPPAREGAHAAAARTPTGSPRPRTPKPTPQSEGRGRAGYLKGHASARTLEVTAAVGRKGAAKRRAARCRCRWCWVEAEAAGNACKACEEIMQGDHRSRGCSLSAGRKCTVRRPRSVRSSARRPQRAERGGRGAHSTGEKVRNGKARTRKAHTPERDGRCAARASPAARCRRGAPPASRAAKSARRTRPMSRQSDTCSD